MELKDTATLFDGEILKEMILEQQMIDAMHKVDPVLLPKADESTLKGE